MMGKKKGKPEEVLKAMLKSCVAMQIEFKELDAEKILSMPYARFDMIGTQLRESAEKAKSSVPKGRTNKSSFGGR